MAVKELFHSEELEAGNNEESTLLQHPYEEEEEEEEEEALSLCDLPIYSTSAEWSGGDFSKGKKEEENDDNEMFEFFSEELTTSTVGSANAENIMFCGKLIPFKSNTTTTTRSCSKKVQLETKGFEIGKVSLVRSATKSRWFLFMFGMSKWSMNPEMELRDIRKRQSRRVPATMFPAPESGKGKRRGVWKVLKSNISMLLGCSSSSKVANDVVRKAAFG